MSRFYGFINNNKEVIITDVLRDNSYNLCYEEELKEYVNEINSLYRNCGILYGIKKEIEDEITTLNKLHEKFDEEGITCFSMISSTLQNLYERLYDEEYDG